MLEVAAEKSEIIEKRSDRTPLASCSHRKGQNSMTTIKCLFCQSDDASELSGCGEMKSGQRNINVHYFCLFFATDLAQKEDFDEENDKLAGFTEHSIQKRKKAAQRHKCEYCSKTGATVKCANDKCKIRFHFPCGRENGVFYIFQGEYPSYCPDHVPTTRATKKFSVKDIPNIEGHCSICQDGFFDYDFQRALRAILLAGCCKNAIFHVKCIQGYAIAAASHHLRCPFCKNVDQFLTDLYDGGIYVPIRDAEWERNGQFSDQNERPCEAQSCQCPHGSNYDANTVEDDDEETWMLRFCGTCGIGCHIGCGADGSPWNCAECRRPIAERTTDESPQVIDLCSGEGPSTQPTPRNRSIPKKQLKVQSLSKTKRFRVIDTDGDASSSGLSSKEDRAMAASRSKSKMRPSASLMDDGSGSGESSRKEKAKSVDSVMAKDADAHPKPSTSGYQKPVENVRISDDDSDLEVVFVEEKKAKNQTIDPRMMALLSDLSGDDIVFRIGFLK